MKFISKKSLKEAEINPLETNNVDLSYDEQYKQAIIKAVASESSATVEYDQILALEEKVSNKELVDHFHDTLADLKNEEVKHIAQLTTKISEIPEMKDAFDAGVEEASSGKEVSTEENEKEEQKTNDENKKTDKKESVQLTEAVAKNRLYNTEKVCQVIDQVLNLNNDQYEILETIFKYADDELQPEEVDKYLTEVSKYFTISDTKLDNIENLIIATQDPRLSRKMDFDSDIASDISTLEDTIEKVYSLAAKEKLFNLINYLKSLEYDGDKSVGWLPEHSIIGGNKPTKRIIS